MNREIKFRVWDNKLNRMLIGTNQYGADEPDFDRSASSAGAFTRLWEAIARFNQSDRFTLMQHTGLKDKNGVEIYEGDILTDGRELGCVLWFKHNCEFVLHYQDYIEEEDLDPDCDVVKHCGWVGLEVIGNIYENPELL